MTERMWCTACGTVTRDFICDCNTYGVGHEMYREPNLVNYADAMQEAAHEQSQRVSVLEEALAPFAKLAALAHTNHKDSRPFIFAFDTAIAQRLTVGDLRRAGVALSQAQRDDAT